MAPRAAISGKAIKAARLAGVRKGADAALSRRDLNGLTLRPSLLLDGPGSGTVSLGPAEFHGQVARDDLAATLAELLHEPRIGRQPSPGSVVRCCGAFGRRRGHRLPERRR